MKPDAEADPYPLPRVRHDRRGDLRRVCSGEPTQTGTPARRLGSLTNVDPFLRTIPMLNRLTKPVFVAACSTGRPEEGAEQGQALPHQQFLLQALIVQLTGAGEGRYSTKEKSAEKSTGFVVIDPALR